jgi:inward rectifier potassium channel
LITLKKINQTVKNLNDTGFGKNSNDNAARLANKDGNVNVKKTGLPFWERISVFHTMITMSRAKFIGCIVLFYVLINLIFASIYLLIGLEHLGGITSVSPLLDFGEAFFFSAQTFTTVGYGRVYPIGFLTSAISSFEALIGILSAALATGLLYGRFSLPEAFLLFSPNILISPYEQINGLMFRMASYKNNHLTNVEVSITLAMEVEENGKMVNQFFNLDLEVSKINSLAFSWTVVHPIDDKSPFKLLTYEDIKNANTEILIFIRAFDDKFSNTVMQRTSYTADELIMGAKFKKMYGISPNGQTTILRLDMINEFDKVELNG